MRFSKEHLTDWAARRLVMPLFRRFHPILVIPSGPQRLWIRGLNRGLRRQDKPTFAPPATLPPLAFVFRHDDVCEVLGDHQHFSVKSFEERMTACSHRFLLGFGFTDEYKKDVALLRSVLRPADRERIAEKAAEHAQAGVKKAVAGTGTIDAVQDVVGPVVAGFLNDYFGVPEIAPPKLGGISPLLLLFLDTASYIFNLEVLTGPTKAAGVAGGAAIKKHLDELISARRLTLPDKEAPNETILDRLLRAEPKDNDRVQRILGGTVSGSIAVTFSQCLSVIDRLMDLSEEERAEVAHVADSEGAYGPTTSAKADEALLGRYVREASRFKPFPAGLLRTCVGPQVIARGTKRERKLADGTIIVALTWSAAFDPEVVRDPQRFHIGREDGEYLLFGTGQHHCVAAQTERPFAQTLMGQMVKALMALPSIRRADGAEGFIQSDNRWPTSFALCFDVQKARREPSRAARAA